MTEQSRVTFNTLQGREQQNVGHSGGKKRALGLTVKMQSGKRGRTVGRGGVREKNVIKCLRALSSWCITAAALLSILIAGRPSEGTCRKYGSFQNMINYLLFPALIRFSYTERDISCDTRRRVAGHRN